MSTPVNPLSQYRTYAYHHILLACDTTETAEVLSKSNEFLDFIRTEQEVNTPSDPYGKYRPRDVNLSRGRTGHYSIIINGTSDASFAISKTSWFTATASPTDGENAFSSFAVEGGLTVQEPRGVDFMNVMAHVADFLESNPSGLIFMLKTIFIGHTSQTFSSSNYANPITYIRPLMFVIYDITADFTIQGGVYNVKFMGLNHGASKTRHIMKGADRVQINLSSATTGCEINTLMGGLCKLQKRINEIYKDYYAEVKRKVEKTVDKDGNKLKFNGREVVYVIQAESPYATKVAGNYSQPDTLVLEGNTNYKIDQFKEPSTDKGEKDEGGIINFGSHPSIESAILHLAKRCGKVQKDLIEGDKHGIKYTPKVATTIISNDKKYYVIYKLRRVIEARNDIVQQVLGRGSDDPNKLNKNIQKNLFTLDYFFTGKNTDIINFDIKMEMGLAFFQTLVTTDNIPNNYTVSTGASIENSSADGIPIEYSDGPTDKQDRPSKLRAKTPIFFSTKFDSKMLRNTLSPKDSASFQALLNRHAALENLEALVEIHGNPGLLNSMNILPSDMLQHQDVNETKANTSDDTPDIFPYWETTPAIVKLNIRMPTTEKDPPYIRADVTKPFWYQGYYYCFGIEHIFNEGLFTQKLNLISLPSSTNYDRPVNKQRDKVSSESQKEKEEVETSTSVSSSVITVTNSSSQQTVTKTTAQRATDTPPPSESDGDQLTVEEYLKAMFKGGRSTC